MENEIINEEVMENIAEEAVAENGGNGLKIAAGVGVAILVGGLAYKFVVKKIVAKIKAKKSEKSNTADEAGVVYTDFGEDEEREAEEA